MANDLIVFYDHEARLATARKDDLARFHRRHGQPCAVAQAGSGSAMSIRHSGDGNATVTDGPLAETREVPGGYYVIDVADLDDARAIARQVPARCGWG